MQPGSLVIYDADTRHVCARNSYVVLGPAKPDRNGKPQVRIHCIETMGGTASPWAPNTRRVLTAPVKALQPIAAFGMRVHLIRSVTHANGHTTHVVEMMRDPTLVPTATRKWGRQYGATWDWMATGQVNKTSHAELIRKAMIAAFYADNAEAA